MGENYNSNLISDDGALTLPHFKDIRKHTLSETYQYFRKLIEGKPIINLNEWMSSNTELSLFDDSLRLMLVEALCLENEVLKILLSQNEYRIKKVLRFEWFFKNLSAEFCTTQIFPCVSVSVRCKIINSLSKYLNNPDEAQKYFAFIKTNYDNARALYILPRCSPEFILSYVNETKATFDFNTGSKILLNICKRYPDTGIQILSTIFDQYGKSLHDLSKYKRIIWYLAGSHSDLMVPFIKKYSSIIPCNTFGKKLTKKLGAKFRQDLFPDFIKNLIFKEETLFSMLGEEEQVKFIAAIVRFQSNEVTTRNWKNSEGNIVSLLKLIPEGKRLAVLEAALKEVYGLNFNDHPKYWCQKMLESLPTKTREPLVAKLEGIIEGDYGMFRKTMGYVSPFSPDCPEQYLYLYPSGLAFDKLKEVLRKTPAINRREEILYQLACSCKINNDLKTLEEIVDYVATRHRNDDPSVIFRFLDGICDFFPASALNSDIFKKLEDLAYFCSLKGHRNDYVYNRWREMYINYCLDHGLNADAQIQTLFDSGIVGYGLPYTFLTDLKSKHAKSLFLILSEKTISWIRENSSEKTKDTVERMIVRMLDTCKVFNQNNQKEKISVKEIPGLSELLAVKVKENFGEVGGENWPLEIWDKYHNDLINSYYRPKCLLYVFKQDPDSIDRYLDGILNIFFTNYFRQYNDFFYFLRYRASFSGKTEKVKEVLLNVFKNGDSVGKRKTALELYSHVCTIDEFCSAVENYIPKQGKVERKAGEEDFDEIQMTVPTLIKHVKPRWRNLEFVLKFFIGDFLKSVLPSLYSCCFNTRCDVAVPFLNKRLEQLPPKVSYVKDIVRLILALSDRTGQIQFSLQFWNAHKHYSVRSIVLRFVSKIFIEQPSLDLFKVLEKHILDCDDAAIEVLPHLHKIPVEFLNDYVSALWGFSEKQKASFKTSFRNNIISNFNEDNIKFLSSEFCESIIKNYLFNPESGIPVEDFVVLYLAADPNTVKKRVLTVLEAVKERKADAKSVFVFLNVLIAKSVLKPANFADVFAVLLENWPEFPPGVLYEERVLLTYHNLYQRVVRKSGDSGKPLAEFGKELRNYFSGVDNLNDLLIIHVGGLCSFFTHFPTEDAIVVLKELVSGGHDRRIGILAVSALPSQAVVWYNKKGVVVQKNIVEGKSYLNEFVGILEGYGDSIVGIYLRSKLEFPKA